MVHGYSPRKKGGGQFAKQVTGRTMYGETNNFFWVFHAYSEAVVIIYKYEIARIHWVECYC